MDTRLIIAVVVIGAIGLYFGNRISQQSQKAEKIHGGPLAMALHQAACSIFISLLPTILAGVFVFHIGLRAVVLGLLMMGIAFLCLMGYAALEIEPKAAARKAKERGWTAEDARASGL